MALSGRLFSWTSFCLIRSAAWLTSSATVERGCSSERHTSVRLIGHWGLREWEHACLSCVWPPVMPHRSAGPRLLHRRLDSTILDGTAAVAARHPRAALDVPSRMGAVTSGFCFSDTLLRALNPRTCCLFCQAYSTSL